MTLTLTSPAFEPGETIPRKYSGEGADVSPPLQWTQVPEGTKELALICDDPDAPTAQPWVHWVIYKIPRDASGLPENIPKVDRLSTPAGALQGFNSWGKTGYGGPMPPPGHGVHHYHFTLFALDAALEGRTGLDKAALLKAMKAHTLAQAKLIGTYQR